MQFMKSIRAGALVLCVLGAAACSNPVTPQEHEEDPVLVLILNGDTEVARGDLAGGSTGEIVVGPGTQSPLLTVTFLDEHGESLDPGDEHVLRVTPDDPDVATWVPTIAGGFSGRVQGGGVADQTDFTFSWVHGTVDAGHSEGDFSIRVTVSP